MLRSRSGKPLRKQTEPSMPGSSLEHLHASGEIPYGFEIDPFHPENQPKRSKPKPRIDYNTCPNCNENDYRTVGRGKYECRNCDYYYEE